MGNESQKYRAQKEVNMNKRIKKKIQKKLNTSLNLGYDHMLSYSEIKWIKKMYHQYDLCLI